MTYNCVFCNSILYNCGATNYTYASIAYECASCASILEIHEFFHEWKTTNAEYFSCCNFIEDKNTNNIMAENYIIDKIYLFVRPPNNTTTILKIIVDYDGKTYAKKLLDINETIRPSDPNFQDNLKIWLAFM